MSSPIWTPAALSSEARPYTAKCWRLVEAQHRVSTLKLVDTLEEQALLEDLIEATKPAVPPECAGLDYLLATPFRYGSYPFGSRFRRAGRTPGVFYASERVETAVAELAFYRLLFYADAPDVPWPADAGEYTAFSAAVSTPLALDLTAPPLDRDADAWTSRTDYGATQALADTTREGGLELIRYRSVRDPAQGANVALLTCRGFARRKPGDRRSWRIRVGSSGVQALCEYPVLRIGFARDAFDDPRLEGMRWER